MTVEGNVTEPEIWSHLNNFNHGQLIPDLFLEYQIVDMMSCPHILCLDILNLKTNQKEIH